MNYTEYVKAFTQMQQDHFKIQEMANDIKIVNMQQYLGQVDETQESLYLKEEFNKLKVKVLATVSRLKEYFIDNNEEFSYPMFKVSIEFFNSYAMAEQTVFIEKYDYEKLNKAFLEEYKEGLTVTLNNKQNQYDRLTKELEKTESAYEKEVGEALNNSENKNPKATSLKAKYQKDFYQRENIFNKLYFIKKEVATINEVLNNQKSAFFNFELSTEK